MRPLPDFAQLHAFTAAAQELFILSDGIKAAAHCPVYSDFYIPRLIVSLLVGAIAITGFLPIPLYAPRSPEDAVFKTR